MDLKEYLVIVKNNLKVFSGIIIVVVAIVFAYFWLRPVAYTASLMLNVAREGTQETADYKYDNFYRIQADEKFSETIVEWLASPAIESDVFSQAGLSTKNFTLKQLSKSFSAEKRSAQIVVVSFATPNAEQAGKISTAISTVLTKNIQSLNSEREKNEWFKIVSHDPITIKNSFDFKIVFLAALALGVFLAFWLVLSIHYLK
jgi:capsular polysaccharide biosynthesis protein